MNSGNLPHLTKVFRKPKPIGTEFKNTADTKTGLLLDLEIKEGKEAMREMKQSHDYGVCCCCMLPAHDHGDGQLWPIRKVPSPQQVLR
jgi:hypothetical protein